MGEGAELLFQSASEESEVETNLFGEHQTNENGQRQPNHFIPVKRA